MIHVVDYVNPAMRNVDHWRTMIPDMLHQHGYEVNIIRGTDSIPGNDSFGGETLYKSDQYVNLYRSLIAGNVSPNDIVIFADAWNPSALSFRAVCESMKLKVKMIGVWRGGLYDMYSPLWVAMWGKRKDWAMALERSLYNVYDCNCYLDESARRRFMQRYSYRAMDKFRLTGFPYESVIDEYNAIGPIEKRNVVVVPHNAVTDEQRDIVRAIQSHLNMFEFVNCQDNRLSRDEYYEVLSTAKVVLAVNLYESDPVSVYEGMVFGCIPVVPDISMYSSMFPEQYRYPAHYVQPPFLNFVRGRAYMFSRIQSIIDSYEQMTEQLSVDTLHMTREYYSNESFIKLLGEL